MLRLLICIGLLILVWVRAHQEGPGRHTHKLHRHTGGQFDQQFPALFFFRQFARLLARQFFRGLLFAQFLGLKVGLALPLFFRFLFGAQTRLFAGLCLAAA